MNIQCERGDPEWICRTNISDGHSEMDFPNVIDIPDVHDACGGERRMVSQKNVGQQCRTMESTCSKLFYGENFLLPEPNQSSDPFKVSNKRTFSESFFCFQIGMFTGAFLSEPEPFRKQ